MSGLNNPLDAPGLRSPVHRAFVLSRSSSLDTVRDYLPANYEAHITDVGEIIIEGHDHAGWTLDGYVIPRLASGLITAVELVCDHCGQEVRPDSVEPREWIHLDSSYQCDGSREEDEALSYATVKGSTKV